MPLCLRDAIRYLQQCSNFAEMLERATYDARLPRYGVQQDVVPWRSLKRYIVAPAAERRWRDHLEHAKHVARRLAVHTMMLISSFLVL